jgi:predicted hotdog family 3-hydroxylacyl-ACP dehydratase
MHEADFPALEHVMPHRGEALLLERVLEHDAEHTVARVDVASQRWLLRADGSVASWLVVEYMAQCVAAHAGLLAHAEHRSAPHGYLIRVRGLRLHVADIPAQARLRVTTRPTRGRPGLGVVSQACEVHFEEGDACAALLAVGTLTLAVHSAPPADPVPAD